MKSFEEYHTSQKRQRAWQEATKKEYDQIVNQSKETNVKAPNQDDDDTIADIQNDEDNNNNNISKMKILPRKEKIGRLLESYEVQLFIVILIYIDLVTCTIMYVLENDVGTLTNSIKVEKVVDDDSNLMRFLSSLCNFTIICFVLELCALMYSFGYKFFTHFGYLLDLIIVSLILLSNTIETNGGDVQHIVGGFLLLLLLQLIELFIPLQLFLGYLRFWRIARLVSTMVKEVEDDHQETKSKLQLLKKHVDIKQMECNHLEASNSNEVILRKEVEKSLHAYKDEVETLKEALKIAAWDIALTVTDEGGTEDETMGDVGSRGRDDGDDKDDVLDKFYDGNDDDDPWQSLPEES